MPQKYSRVAGGMTLAMELEDVDTIAHTKEGKARSLYDLIAPAARPVHSDELIARALAAIRAHLGMDVSYVSQFDGDRTIFRVVDAPGLEHVIKPGNSRPLDDVYCRHILEGRLPQLMPDTAAEPVAAAMPITQAIPIGKHISAPIRMPDGSIYGMFCCLGFGADRSLRDRDLVAAFEIARDLATAKAAEEKEYRIRKVIDDKEISTLYQPIWRLENPRPLGFECLSRFSAAPNHSPQGWFAEAAEVGPGASLELAAAERGLAVLDRLPPDIYLAGICHRRPSSAAIFPR